MLGSQQFFGSADDWRLQTLHPDGRFNQPRRFGVRNVLEVPRHQILYTIDSRNRDVERIPRLALLR